MCCVYIKIKREGIVFCGGVVRYGEGGVLVGPFKRGERGGEGRGRKRVQASHEHMEREKVRE
jgi:hypothetical protein